MVVWLADVKNYTFSTNVFLRFGVEAPSKLSLLGGVALIAVGGALVLSVLVIFVMKYFLLQSKYFPRVSGVAADHEEAGGRRHHLPRPRQIGAPPPPRPRL